MLSLTHMLQAGLMVPAGSQLLFHMILDEAQTGLEADLSERALSTSHHNWFKSIMTAHHMSMKVLQDVVLLTIAGTTMDIATIVLASTFQACLLVNPQIVCPMLRSTITKSQSSSF